MTPSSSPRRAPSSFESSDLASSFSFSCIACQRMRFPMITTSRTRLSSKPYWSCFSTESRLGREMVPVSGSRSPARIFMKVVLPAPFGDPVCGLGTHASAGDERGTEQVAVEERVRRLVGPQRVLGARETVALVLQHQVLDGDALLAQRLDDAVRLILADARVVVA